MGTVISVGTPAGKTTHGEYGVWGVKHKGKSCSPYRAGWYIWES